MLIAWGAYLNFGFAPAVAFLAAGLTVLFTYILDWVLARGLKLGRARLALALILGGWVVFVALRHELLGHAIEGLIARVQPVAS